MNKLRELRIEKKLLQSDIAKIINKSERTVGFYETEERDMGTETLSILSKFFNVSIDYLLGKTDIRNSSASIIKIPLLGIVKAGYNYLANENIIDHISVTDSSLNNEDFFALKVKGDSMVPEIYENDIAIIKKQDDFENGDYVVALVNDDEATIKKAVKTEDGIELIAVNPYYPKRFFSKNEIKEIPVKIIGIVYNITRNFK